MHCVIWHCFSENIPATETVLIASLTGETLRKRETSLKTLKCKIETNLLYAPMKCSYIKEPLFADLTSSRQCVVNHGFGKIMLFPNSNFNYLIFSLAVSSDQLGYLHCSASSCTTDTVL